MGTSGRSDPTGHYEAVIFSEGLAEHRDTLEPGAAVLLFLSAEVQGDEVRARIQSVEPLDQGTVKIGSNLPIYLNDAAPLASLQKRLDSKGDGEVTLIIRLRDGGEAEI